ncbi:MAG TPA: VanZ family protein [Clostridia bacterium]|nr:VanZ family protein [Clostridia bacterium]
MDKAKRHAWILPILWMGVIFIFSHQAGEESAGLSGGVTQVILTFAEGIGIRLDEVRFHGIVRVMGHFIIFFVLGQLWYITLRIRGKSPNHASIIAFLLCIGYAFFDELHQYFVPGRACELSDVLVDGAGAGVAIIIGWLTQFSGREKAA